MSALNTPGLAPAPVRRVIRQSWRNGSAQLGERALAEEVPVAFSYDGTTHAVLMATPDDLEEFALGFSYTEGIIGTAEEIAESHGWRPCLVFRRLRLSAKPQAAQ